MVRLITDTPQYRNDIAEEIRLFLGLVDVTEEDAPAELTLEILTHPDGNRVTGRLLPDGTDCVIPITDDDGTPLVHKRQHKRAVKLAAFTLLRQRCGGATPWGALTGIRPTKLWRDNADRDGAETADRLFSDVLQVSPEKLALCKTIVAVQRPALDSVTPTDADVYLGIPYCRTRCLYCSFGAEVAGGETVLDSYLFHLLRDAAEGARILDASGFSVRALYIGGGTPTVLTAKQLDTLLSAVRRLYPAFSGELTVEAGRPDTITEEKLLVLRAHGVNRLSINPQTMRDRTLTRIGRLHTAGEIDDAFLLARRLGFDNINMDVIAGLPGEDADDMAYTLDRIAALGPDSLTVHTLAIKRSSRLKAQLEQYPLPPAETVERMLEMGGAAAARMGMRPYYLYRQKYMNGNLENVGYARPGKECVYNIDMMEETVSIMAGGAGAMTKRVYGQENRVERIPNPKHVPTYADKLALLHLEKHRLFSD